MERPVRIVERRRCPHCNKNLSLKTYKAHKRLYFNKHDVTWLTLNQTGSPERHTREGASSSPPQSEFDDSDDFVEPSPPPAYES